METSIEASFANLSVVDLSKEDLQIEYQHLKKLYIEAIADSEKKNQQIYDFKRQVTTASALEKEYLQEIETLQCEDKNESKKLAQVIVNLEEELKSAKELHNVRVQILEEELSRKDKEIAGLQEELKLVTQINSNGNSKEEVDKLLEENAKLKSECFEFAAKFDIVEESLETQKKNNLELQEELMQVSKDYKELEENYNNKKSELIEKNDLIENLQDELVAIKSELDVLKSKPLDAESRGNSLFAEVDDRRVQLTKEMSYMKSKFNDMRLEKAQYEKEIKHLQRENFELIEKYKEEVVKRKQDDNMLVVAHADRIKVLESLVKSYQKKLEALPVKYVSETFQGDELAFVESLLNRKDNEEEELKQKLNWQSMTEMMMTSKLRDANIELRKLKFTAAEYKNEIANLNLKLKELSSGKELPNDEGELKEKCQPKLQQAKPLPKAEMMKLKQFKSIIKNTNKEEIKDKFDAVKPGMSNIIPVDVESTWNHGNTSNPESTMKFDADFHTGTQLNIENQENRDSLNVINSSKDITRKVLFAEDTKEDRTSNVTRRKGKIITCKTLFVPSKKKEC